MASRKTSDLIPQMQEYVHAFKSECAKRHLEVIIYCTFRPMDEQARLWRQGRSLFEIQQGVKKLIGLGRGDLADVLSSVGPQYGEKVTRALPGQSPHNYGMAFDGAPLLNGRISWSQDGRSGEMWDQYTEIAHSVGLETLSFERPHCQLPGFDWRDHIMLSGNGDVAYGIGYDKGFRDAIESIIEKINTVKVKQEQNG